MIWAQTNNLNNPTYFVLCKYSNFMFRLFLKINQLLTAPLKLVVNNVTSKIKFNKYKTVFKNSV